MASFGKPINALGEFLRGSGAAMAREARAVSGALAHNGWLKSGYFTAGGIGAGVGGAYGFATSDRRDRGMSTLKGAAVGLGAGLLGRGAWNVGKHYVPEAYGRVGAGIGRRLDASSSAGLRGLAADVRERGVLSGVAESLDRRFNLGPHAPYGGRGPKWAQDGLHRAAEGPRWPPPPA